jgi:hypothetical protein
MTRLMVGFRFVLILMVAAAMDLGSPLLPQTSDAFEGLEEFEEAAHGQRPAPRPVRAESPAPTPGTIAAVTVEAPRPPRRRPPVPVTTAPVRKAPPPLSEPAAALDDH